MEKVRLVTGTSAWPYIFLLNIYPDNKAAVFSLTSDKEGDIYAGLSKYGV